MSRQANLVKNTFVLAIGNILPKFSTLITLPILTACLTKEQYGTYDLVIVLVSFLLPAATLQIHVAAFRYLIDCRDDEKSIKEIVSNIYAFILPISVVPLIVLAFVIPGTLLEKALICGYFFVDILVCAARQVARGLARNMDFSISAIISSVGKLVFTVVFVYWLQISLVGALLSLLLGSAISLVVLAYRIKLLKYLDMSLLSWKEIKELISYSWPMVPNSMALWVMNLSDRLVLTVFMGAAANAVYAVANKIPSMLTLAQTTFTMAWQENASVASKDEDSDAYYTQMFRAMFDLMAGALGLLICATPLLFIILIRGDYSEAYYHMPLLLMAMFFYSQCSFFSGIYVANKATKSVGITTIIAAALNLAIDFASVHFIGIYAASISTLVSFIFLFIYRMIDVRKLVKIKYDLKHILIVIGILIVEAVFCFMQNTILNIVNIIFGIVVFTVLNRPLIIATFKKCKSIIKKKAKR